MVSLTIISKEVTVLFTLESEKSYETLVEIRLCVPPKKHGTSKHTWILMAL